MYSKPILKSIANFDASNQQTIDFVTNEAPEYLNYVIENNATGVEVVNESVPIAISSVEHTMYNLSFVLYSSDLINGVKYRMKIRVGNFKRTDWSNFSNYRTFSCLAAPVVTIDNFIDTTAITEQNILLTGSYSQSNNDGLASYRFIVYNMDDSVFAEQQQTYSQTISYYLTGLEAKKNYKIKLECTSQAGITTSSDIVTVSVSYFKPNLNGVLELTNSINGAVKIKAFLSQIKGVKNEYVSYSPADDPDWLDITDERGLFYVEDGLNVVFGDYTLVLWLSNIVTGKELYKIHGSNGTIRVLYEDNKFKAFLDINDVRTLYTSEEITVTPEDTINLSLIVKDQRILLKAVICE